MSEIVPANAANPLQGVVPTHEQLVARVQADAHALARSLSEATEANVSQALLLPALFQVFREAGMLPESLDLGSLLGMLR